MTDGDVVERVGALLNRAVTPLRPRQSHHKVAFATAIKGSEAVALMRAVGSHMGPTRVAQIQRAIASWRGGRGRRRLVVSTCAVSGCMRPVAIRGLCLRHYKVWWKAQKFGRTSRVAPRDPPPAFAIEVDVRSCNEMCDVAWLAGLLEGEGTFSVARSGALSYPSVSVNMCDQAVVRRAAQLLGTTVWSQKPRYASWRPSYATAVSGSAATPWMIRLRPFMGIRRRAAIDAALAAYHPIRLVSPPMTCTVQGCDAPHRSRGLCHKHYMGWMRDVARGRAPRVATLR